MEWLRRGLRNCQQVGPAHGAKPLNHYWNTLVQEHNFSQIGCTQRCSPADVCQENERIISQSTKCLDGHWAEDMAGWQIVVFGCLPLWRGCRCASCLYRTSWHVRCSQCMGNCHVPRGPIITIIIIASDHSIYSRKSVKKLTTRPSVQSISQEHSPLIKTKYSDKLTLTCTEVQWRSVRTEIAAYHWLDTRPSRNTANAIDQSQFTIRIQLTNHNLSTDPQPPP